MNYESLIVEKTGAVGTVRLNRPEKHNALNAQLSHELIDALDRLEADDGERHRPHGRRREGVLRRGRHGGGRRR